MARSIPEDLIKRVQNTANIVDIVGESVVLKKTGRNYVGLCPFHAEKTPSFSVSPEKQIFYCFGCHTGGSVFSFLMQQEGISFPEAVREVAARYAIEIPEERMTPAQQRRLSEKEEIFRINDIAGAYFRQSLKDQRSGQKAMAYLLGRGMTRALIEQHQLGYSPQGWDGLLNHLRKQRVALPLAEKSGLIIPRKSGSGYYDRFRDRVMFPILDAGRQIIGFGGRVMGDELPKYLNSPETPVYNKRRSLYGIHIARPKARSERRIYVVEGYFDVLALHLYGIENAVGTLGTALTPEHARLLKGLVGDGEVVLVFDSDLAGIKASRRSIDVFESESLTARILILPQGDDPDSYLRAHGPGEFLVLTDRALSFIPFLIDSAIEQYGLSLEGKVKVVAELQNTLASVQDKVARMLYIQQLAERLDIAEEAILEKVREVERTPSRTGPGEGRSSERGDLVRQHQRLELQLVAMMIRFPTMIDDIVARKYLDTFESAALKHIADAVVKGSENGVVDVADLVSRISEPYYRNLMAKLAMADNQWDRQGCDRIMKQFESRMKRITNANLQKQIEIAEKKGDYELLSDLLRRKQTQAKKETIH